MKATARLLIGTRLIVLFIAPLALPQNTVLGQTEALIDHHEAVLDAMQRTVWRRGLDGSPMVHPTLPPKLAENRR
jgi:hypothetical protein